MSNYEQIKAARAAADEASKKWREVLADTNSTQDDRVAAAQAYQSAKAVVTSLVNTPKSNARPVKYNYFAPKKGPTADELHVFGAAEFAGEPM